MKMKKRKKILITEKNKWNRENFIKSTQERGNAQVNKFWNEKWDIVSAPVKTEMTLRESEKLCVNLFYDLGEMVRA